MKWKLLAPLVLLVALVTFLAVRTVDRSGIMLEISPHFSGRCAPVTGLVGAEDITIDQQRAYAYISTDDRRRRNAGEEVQGSIMGLDLGDPQSRPTALTDIGDRPFHPHGISLFETMEGERLLFAINHASPSAHQVELFRVGSDHALAHVETIVAEALVSPNDLVAVGPRAFYVTNDHGSRAGLMRTLEDYLALPLADIAYFDGSGMREVASGLSYPNGITVDAGGRMLYVAETTGRALTSYRVDPSTGALERNATVRVGTGADNLEWSPDGTLLLTGHPKLLDFLAHAASPEALSPSQVLAVTTDGDRFETREIYLDDGAGISAASVAARHGDTLLIGSVFEEKILRCTLE